MDDVSPLVPSWISRFYPSSTQRDGMGFRVQGCGLMVIPAVFKPDHLFGVAVCFIRPLMMQLTALARRVAMQLDQARYGPCAEKSLRHGAALTGRPSAPKGRKDPTRRTMHT